MTGPQGGALTLQGIPVQQGSVNPNLFFGLTRRHRNPEYNKPFAGLSLTDYVELKKSDIIAGLRVRFSGQVVVTLGTGTAASTMAWPHKLVDNFKFVANGQSNLININGLQAKVREFMREGVDDHGIPQTVGAGTVVTGTLSKSSESWGVGAGATLSSGTFPVELEWLIPVAEDEKDLAGAIFAQTSTQDLVLQIGWALAANLFTTTGNATVALSGNVIVETEKFSIPAVNGLMVLPDLSLFHSMIGTRSANSLANGDNELRLIGQGAGKQLLRVFYNVWNGAAPQTPLAATATNYGPQSWRYGTNETPETYQDGRSMRQVNEDEYGVDIGNVWGLLSHEFAVRNAFRDTVDMGQTSELRLVTNIASGVTLNAPVLEYVQETMFAAGN